MRRSVHAASLLAIVGLVLVSFSGVQNASSLNETEFEVSGPYIDEVIFQVIPNQDLRILSLQAGDIEMDTTYFDPVHLDTLEADPEINIYRPLRNGYGHITINCRDYPLNISGLRRAFAYAYDKDDISEGWCVSPFYKMQDSIVPYVNGFCIEDQLEWHYYDSDIAKGTEILNNLHFEIDNETGYRLAPNGEPFDIVVECSASCGIPGVVIQAVDALKALHIDARYRAADFNEYISRLYSHGNYDMVFYATNFYSNDIDWLAYEYWSENADEEYQNPTNFRNATYDSWRDQLLYSTSYEEVYEAAAEMQKILHYNVPRLVVYENINFQGYRNDVFTGHSEDLGNQIAGQWTMRKIHRLDSEFMGTVPIALKDEIISFNPFTYERTGNYAFYGREDDTVVLDLIYSSLFDKGPDCTPVADLVVQMIEEMHDENSYIPENHLRFTIDIVENATWSDGIPLTAYDVVFTFLFMAENNVTKTPFNTDWSFSQIFAIWAPTPYRVVIECFSESYWHFNKFAYEYILPMHILNNQTLMEGVNYLTWNPSFDESQPLVTSGPFILTSLEEDTYRFTYNPEFHYAPTRLPTEPVSSTTISSSITTNGADWLSIFNISLISGSGVVIIFCSAYILNQRRKKNG